MKKTEEELQCPKCGGTNINQAGIPYQEEGRTQVFYQCQSDYGKKGCGYLAHKQEFIIQRQLMAKQKE